MRDLPEPASDLRRDPLRTPELLRELPEGLPGQGVRHLQAEDRQANQDLQVRSNSLLIYICHN